MEEKSVKRYVRQILVLALFLSVASLIVLFFFRTDIFAGIAGRLMTVLMPFVYGGVIAYLLRPVCLWIERGLIKAEKMVLKKEHPGSMRMVSILLSLFLMLLLVFLLLLAVLPELVNSIAQIVSDLPNQIEAFQIWLNGMDQGGTSHEIVTYVNDAMTTLTDYLENFLQKTLLPNLQSVITQVTSSVRGLIDVLKNFGLGLIISAYLLGGWEKFRAQGKLAIYGLLPEKAADFIRMELQYTNRMFSGFINGKILDSLIIGVICFVFCSIVRMPYAMLVSVVVGVTNVIPFFGPYLGAIPSAVLILTVSPGKCLVFIIFVLILQQVDGNVIGPSILGDRMGLSSFWILASILFFGSLWGLVGMLVGVPLFAVLYDIIRRIVLYGIRTKHQEEKLAEYQREMKAIEKEEKPDRVKQKRPVEKEKNPGRANQKERGSRFGRK